LHKTINAGFVVAMFFDFVLQKFRVCIITACMRKQQASLSEGCRSVFGKPAEQAASAK
jgi:hypothetical protein